MFEDFAYYAKCHGINLKKEEMTKDALNELLRVQRKLISQDIKLSSTISHSAKLIEKHFQEFYEGKLVEIKVQKINPPVCDITGGGSGVIEEEQKVIGQIEYVRFSPDGKFIRIEFWGGDLWGMLYTSIINIELIKILE